MAFSVSFAGLVICRMPPPTPPPLPHLREASRILRPRHGPGYPRAGTMPAGALRLASPHLAAQTGWLFPLALIGGIAAWARIRPFRPLAREHLSFSLWAGWALCYGIYSVQQAVFFMPITWW